MLLGTKIMLFWMPKLCRPIQMTGNNGYISEQKREKIGIIYAKASGEWPNGQMRNMTVRSLVTVELYR